MAAIAEHRLHALLEERLEASRRLALLRERRAAAELQLRTGSAELRRLAPATLTDMPEEVAPAILAKLDAVSVGRLACVSPLLRDFVRNSPPPAAFAPTSPVRVGRPSSAPNAP
eukprot:COSAG04_NODE_8423_length_977_cov_1.916856_2_plen_114_part_00